MDSLDKIALMIGYSAMASGGAFVACAFFLIAYLVAGVWGKEVHRRITRVYHLYVIRYWLARLEAEGTHVFAKVSADAKRDQAAQEPTHGR